MTKGKIAAVLLALAPVIGIAGIFSARSICACGDAELFWGGKLKMSPVTAEPRKVRAAIIEQLPVGSTKEQVMGFISQASQASVLERRCKQGPREIACHFPVAEEWFGLRKRGFFVDFALDEKGRFSDTAVRGYVLWFEEPRPPARPTAS